MHSNSYSGVFKARWNKTLFFFIQGKLEVMMQVLDNFNRQLCSFFFSFHFKLHFYLKWHKNQFTQNDNPFSLFFIVSGKLWPNKCQTNKSTFWHLDVISLARALASNRHFCIARCFGPYGKQMTCNYPSDTIFSVIVIFLHCLL